MATFPLRVEEGPGATFMLERQGPAPTKERLEMGDKVQPAADRRYTDTFAKFCRTTSIPMAEYTCCDKSRSSAATWATADHDMITPRMSRTDARGIAACFDTDNNAGWDFRKVQASARET